MCVCVLFFRGGEKMYVDAEFCQRKWADIQLDHHNKGAAGRSLRWMFAPTQTANRVLWRLPQ